MTIAIALNTDNINNLDISLAATVIEELLQSGAVAVVVSLKEIAK